MPRTQNAADVVIAHIHHLNKMKERILSQQPGGEHTNAKLQISIQDEWRNWITESATLKSTNVKSCLENAIIQDGEFALWQRRPIILLCARPREHIFVLATCMNFGSIHSFPSAFFVFLKAINEVMKDRQPPPSFQLLVSVGSSTDPRDLKPVLPNDDAQPVWIESDEFVGQVVIRIRGFNRAQSGHLPDALPDSSWFHQPSAGSNLNSIQIQGRFKREWAGDQVVFGVCFDNISSFPPLGPIKD